MPVRKKRAVVDVEGSTEGDEEEADAIEAQAEGRQGRRARKKEGGICASQRRRRQRRQRHALCSGRNSKCKSKRATAIVQHRDELASGGIGGSAKINGQKPARRTVKESGERNRDKGRALVSEMRHRKRDTSHTPSLRASKSRNAHIAAAAAASVARWPKVSGSALPCVWWTHMSTRDSKKRRPKPVKSSRLM